MSRTKKKDSKILSSTLNSNCSGLPEFDSIFTPIPKPESKKDSSKPIPKSDGKKVASKPAKKSSQKEKLSEDSYMKYLRSLYQHTMMEEKLSEEKSKIELHLSALSKELESQKCVLEKSEKRLMDLSLCAEGEMMLRDENDGITQLLGKLDSSNLETVTDVTNRLNTLRHVQHTKNIEVPRSSESVAEFQKIMDDIVSDLRSISGATTPHAETYSEANELLNSITELQEATTIDLQNIQNQKSTMQDLVLHSSRERSRQMQRELAEDSDILNILKDFYEELK